MRRRLYVSAEVYCPYYKGEQEKRICCEGATANSTIVNEFLGSCLEHKAQYCCHIVDWQKCPVAVGLTSKYL